MKHFTGKLKVQDLIADALANEIIPSIISSKAAMSSQKNYSPLSNKRNEQFLAEFSNILISGDKDVAVRMTQDFLRDQPSVTNLFLGLYTNSARLLGEMWVQDLCSFGDVTIGLTVLHDLVRQNTQRLRLELEPTKHEVTLCLSPIPGQEHVFGAFMLEAFLLAKGYNVETSLAQTREIFLNHVATKEYSMIALSVAENEQVKECKKLIQSIRNMSLNQDIKILVGGYPFIVNDDLYLEVGADATADNAMQALEVIETICNDRMRIN